VVVFAVGFEARLGRRPKTQYKPRMFLRRHP